jgi:hypothetical protein
VKRRKRNTGKKAEPEFFCCSATFIRCKSNSAMLNIASIKINKGDSEAFKKFKKKTGNQHKVIENNFRLVKTLKVSE